MGPPLCGDPRFGGPFFGPYSFVVLPTIWRLVLAGGGRPSIRPQVITQEPGMVMRRDLGTFPPNLR